MSLLDGIILIFLAYFMICLAAGGLPGRLYWKNRTDPEAPGKSMNALGIIVLMVMFGSVIVHSDEQKYSEESVECIDSIYVQYNGKVYKLEETEEIKKIFGKRKFSGNFYDYEYDEDNFIALIDEDDHKNDIWYYFVKGKNNVYKYYPETKKEFQADYWYTIPRSSGRKLEKILKKYHINIKR